MKIVAITALAALLAVACTSDPDEPDGDAAEPSTTTLAGSEDTISPPDGGDVGVVSFDEPQPDPTPLGIDEDVRIGVLENGLTYYVRSNGSPGNAVSLRLAVAAGGVNEDPRGTGAAHFLEHMMFNGTSKFPGNTLDDALRSIGAEIGPDFNAYTSDTETVYQIAVTDDDDNVDIAFDVLVEWASAATIDPVETANEAPVVREELRLRDESGDGLINVAFEQAYYLGTPYEGVSVSGTPETVNSLTDQDLRAFYDTWYRPDNMAIVAVGDRSLDSLEEEIIDRFSSLQPRGALVPAPETSDFELRTEPYIELVVEPSFGDSFVSVDIPLRTWDLNTRGGNELQLTEIILGLMIDSRLNEGVDSGRLNLRRAGGGWFSYARDLVYLGFNVDADDLEAGTEEFMTELQGSIQNPFTQSELDRATAVIRSSQEQRLAQSGTTQDSDFANGLVNHFIGGGDIQSVDDSVDMVIEILDELGLAAVNNHYGWMLTTAAPIVIVVGPDATRVGDREEHLAGVQRAAQAVVDQFDDDVEEIDVLVESPNPVEEVERKALDKNNGFELVFGNGTRVLFSESDISEEQVVLVSESPGGRSMLSDDDGPIAGAAISAVASSGLGPWDPIQVRRYLADLEVALSPYVADFSEGFSGASSTRDVEALFELLHLSLISPRVDDVPFSQQLEFARDAVERAALDSGTAANIAVSDARTGGGALAAVATPAQLDVLTPTVAKRIWDARFGSLDEHVIVVVGDVDPGVVIDLARTWIGSLPDATNDDDPAQPPLPGVVSERLAVGSGTSGGSFRLLSVGEADESISNRVLAQVAASILNDRLFTVVREQLGATYGGSAQIEFSEPGNEIEVLISVDGDPGRIDEIADTVSVELDELRSGSLTQADFDEAISILRSEYGFISNGFIIEALFDEAYQPADRVLDRTTQLQALDRFTLDDVTDFLVSAVTDSNRIDIRNTR